MPDDAPMEGTAEPERIVREVTFAVEGDGRTIEARIVPYNTDMRVVDLPENGGTGVPYVERWLPGVFDRQANAANRVEVLLNFEHQRGISNVVGHGTALREAPDALYGTFRVHPGPDGDKALHLVNEGILTGLSVEAVPRKSNRTAEGIVERIKATLDNVALCRGGRAAYPQAQVLAVREGTTIEEPPEPPPDPEPPAPPEPERRSDVDELLSRVGYEPLLRRAIVRGQWDGAASRFDDAQWAKSCILDRGPQFDTPKTRYAFPVLEPNGDLNVNGMHAAAARLNQAKASPQAKAAAARKLMRLYRQAGEDPPPMMMSMAGRS